MTVLALMLSTHYPSKVLWKVSRSLLQEYLISLSTMLELVRYFSLFLQVLFNAADGDN